MGKHLASPSTDKPRTRGPLKYDPQAEVVRAEHWPLVLGLSSATLWRRRQAGQFVPVIRLGENSLGARRRDLEQWLDDRRTPR
jgi:predicted DNA-binding transcriptional regulator AlpA